MSIHFLNSEPTFSLPQYVLHLIETDEGLFEQMQAEIEDGDQNLFVAELTAAALRVMLDNWTPVWEEGSAQFLLRPESYFANVKAALAG